MTEQAGGPLPGWFRLRRYIRRARFVLPSAPKLDGASRRAELAGDDSLACARSHAGTGRSSVRNWRPSGSFVKISGRTAGHGRPARPGRAALQPSLGMPETTPRATSAASCAPWWSWLQRQTQQLSSGTGAGVQRLGVGSATGKLGPEAQFSLMTYGCNRRLAGPRRSLGREAKVVVAGLGVRHHRRPVGPSGPGGLRRRWRH